MAAATPTAACQPRSSRPPPGRARDRPPAAHRAGSVTGRRRPRAVPAVLAAVVVAAAIVLSLRLSAAGRPVPPCRASGPVQASFVPAFFEPPAWDQAVSDGRAPGVMILNPASGPGAAPDPGLQAAVRHASA